MLYRDREHSGLFRVSYLSILSQRSLSGWQHMYCKYIIAWLVIERSEYLLLQRVIIIEVFGVWNSIHLFSGVCRSDFQFWLVLVAWFNNLGVVSLIILIIQPHIQLWISYKYLLKGN